MGKPNKAKLVKEAEELKIELTGKESVSDLAQAIEIKKAENDVDENKNKKDDDKKVDNKDDKKDNKPAGGKKGRIFYHVKVKAFKNGEDRVDIGLYESKKPIKRFENLADQYVERFDGEVPAPKLHEIAKKFVVDIYEKGGKKARKDGEILEELLQQL